MMPRAHEMCWGDGSGEASGRHRESQATAIVRLATEADVELWHTPAGDPYITVRVNQHREHHALLSRGARDYLTRLYYVDAAKAPSTTAMQAAIATLSNIARFDGAAHDVHVRIAGDGEDHIYLDLGDPQWRAVQIMRDGYRVVSDPPVRFRRARGLLPLPAPVSGGSINDMRPFVNVANDEDFALLISWKVTTFKPRGPYPVLILMGEQGSAKTTEARVLRRLIDPNVSDVRSEPRERRDLAIAADNGHVVAFDNLSHLSPWLSDAICRLATGGGFSTRTLYENREEEIFDGVKPVILNGISQVATRPDLLDRAIVLTLPVIRDRQRRDEADFWRAFEGARPRILGALLDGVVTALRRTPNVQLSAKPRMADFAIWSVAAEPAFPWPEGTFLNAYAGNRQGSIEATLDGDPVAEVVRALAPWVGTAAELLAELNRRTSEEIKRRKEWFSQPRQVSDTLRRLAPALRRIGIDVTLPGKHNREPGTGRRLITIEAVAMPENPGPDASRASRPSQTPDSHGDFRDVDRDVGADSSWHSSRLEAPISRLRDACDERDAAGAPLSAEEGDDDAEYYGGA